jgi:hypothetical protein
MRWQHNKYLCLIMLKTIVLTEKIYRYKNMCLGFLYNFCLKHFCSSNYLVSCTWVMIKMCAEMLVNLCVKCLLWSSYFNKNETEFKTPIFQISWKSNQQFISCIWTEREGRDVSWRAVCSILKKIWAVAYRATPCDCTLWKNSKAVGQKRPIIVSCY